MLDQISAHFIHAVKGVMYRRVISFAPSVGDELRFSDDRFYTVVRLVWVYDEPGVSYSRLNIEIKDASDA